MMSPTDVPPSRGTVLSAMLSNQIESTRMFMEAAQAAECVHTQLSCNESALRQLGALLRTLVPRAVVTCARGSSDHAATFARYLIETRLGLLTSSVSPSISSVYGVQQDLRQCLFLAISQSGRSPDLLAAVAAAKSAGATVVALVNVEDSPLAEAAHHVVPLHAGAETSVAATKSFIAALAAMTQLLAMWSNDQSLLGELMRAPDYLAQAWNLDWSPATALLQPHQNLFVIGRGLGLGVAQEAALKLKETCGVHAEAFSGAEVRHGPMALLNGGVPVLVLTQDDATLAGLQTLAADLVQSGVPVLFTGTAPASAIQLPTLAAHAALTPMLHAQSFYRVANALAMARGFDPDHPPRLSKVTETF